MVVSSNEMMTRITPPASGSCAMFATPLRSSTIALIGMFSSSVTPMPSRPEMSPMMNASALKTCEMSFLLAPMDHRMPISFVRSSTEI